MLKSNWKMTKEKWAILLICGIILLILAVPFGSGQTAGGNNSFPADGASGSGAAGNSMAGSGTAGSGAAGGASGNGLAAAAGGRGSGLSEEDEERVYERELEERVKKILKNVQGVGQVDVMITLKSSKEKILHVDLDTSRTANEEKDSAGGTRISTEEQRKETALMAGKGQEEGPVVEKEIQPEIAGIVISAQGGGSAAVKADISDAMQALFNVPAHKIKVLKRVE